MEKPDVKNAPSNLSVVGRYLLDSKITDFMFQRQVLRVNQQ